MYERRGVRLRIAARGVSLLTREERSVPLVTVEYVGRGGHPSSYALLGGDVNVTTGGLRYDLPSDGDERFRGALVGRADKVRLGLPVEYRGILNQAMATRRWAGAFTVREAAYGLIGSSPKSFAVVGLAARLLAEQSWQDPPDASLVWACWDEARAEVALSEHRAA